MYCENYLEKNTDTKNRKNSKNQSEISACEQKTTSEKPNFCSNTVFSLYFKIRAKKFTPQNHSGVGWTKCFLNLIKKDQTTNVINTKVVSEQLRVTM